MSFTRTRSDGVKVKIVSLPTSRKMSTADYYQWGKNNANLEHSVEQTRIVAESFKEDVTTEESDAFWSGYHENKI